MKDIGKIILFLGVFLVIFSSFIFGIISWNNYGDLFKILFFAFETVLFFGLSFIASLYTLSTLSAKYLDECDSLETLAWFDNLLYNLKDVAGEQNVILQI